MVVHKEHDSNALAMIIGAFSINPPKRTHLGFSFVLLVWPLSQSVYDFSNFSYFGGAERSVTYFTHKFFVVIRIWWENVIFLSLNSDRVIITKCCTCHDSSAVMACAKFCSDVIARNRITAQKGVSIRCELCLKKCWWDVPSITKACPEKDSWFPSRTNAESLCYRRNNIRENISTHCGLVMPYGELSGTTSVQALPWCIAWGQPEGDFRINTWAIISNINLQITDLEFYLYLPGNTDFIQKQEKKPASPSNFFNFFGVYCIDSEKQHWFWQWVGIIQM